MLRLLSRFFSVFFFNDTATTEIYPLSLHDALPISSSPASRLPPPVRKISVRLPQCGQTKSVMFSTTPITGTPTRSNRSEEHTSELQSRLHLVCRLLLEKKKKSKK